MKKITFNKLIILSSEVIVLLYQIAILFIASGNSYKDLLSWSPFATMFLACYIFLVFFRKASIDFIINRDRFLAFCSNKDKNFIIENANQSYVKAKQIVLFIAIIFSLITICIATSSIVIGYETLLTNLFSIWGISAVIIFCLIFMYAIIKLRYLITKDYKRKGDRVQLLSDVLVLQNFLINVLIFRILSNITL